MDDPCAAKARPRDRIVDTASGLFRKHGIRGIGVDAIAEAAGTNKMTLYRHFGSKDELIAECLRDVAARAEAVWTEFETTYPGDPLAQLHAWVRFGAACVFTQGRGCDLANAAVELPEGDHPARRVIDGRSPELKFRRHNSDDLPAPHEARAEVPGAHTRNAQCGAGTSVPADSVRYAGQEPGAPEPATESTPASPARPGTGDPGCRS